MHVAVDRPGVSRFHLDRRGNVAAALCSASASSILGMFLTPLLAGFVLHANGGFSPHALRSIGFEMLLPFLAGQLVQPRIGNSVRQWRRVLGGKASSLRLEPQRLSQQMA